MKQRLSCILLLVLFIATSCSLNWSSAEMYYEGLEEGYYYAISSDGNTKYILHIAGDHEADLYGVPATLSVYTRGVISETWSSEPDYSYSGSYMHQKTDVGSFSVSGYSRRVSYHVDKFNFSDPAALTPPISGADMSGSVDVLLDPSTSLKEENAENYSVKIGTKVTFMQNNDYTTTYSVCGIAKIGTYWEKVTSPR